jgi:hypothetical protein
MEMRPFHDYSVKQVLQNEKVILGKENELAVFVPRKKLGNLQLFQPLL